MKMKARTAGDNNYECHHDDFDGSTDLLVAY